MFRRHFCNIHRGKSSHVTYIIWSFNTLQQSNAAKIAHDVSKVSFSATSPTEYTLGERAEKYFIYPSVPLPGTSCLSFPVQWRFAVAVGATAHQWAGRAAICQCLVASRDAEGFTMGFFCERERASRRREKRVSDLCSNCWVDGWMGKREEGVRTGNKWRAVKIEKWPTCGENAWRCKNVTVRFSGASF